MGLFGGLFGGGGGGGGGGGSHLEIDSRPVYTPDQEALLNELLAGLGGPMRSGLGNLGDILGGDKESFDRFFAPARRGFEEETLPSIAERFTGSLGEGSQRSSSFGQALGSAGKDLEEEMFSKRMGMQTDALAQLMNMFNPAMAPRQQYFSGMGQDGGGGGGGGGFFDSFMKGGGIGSIMGLFG